MTNSSMAGSATSSAPIISTSSAADISPDQDHQDEAERDLRRTRLPAGRNDLRLRTRFLNWWIWSSVSHGLHIEPWATVIACSRRLFQRDCRSDQSRWPARWSARTRSVHMERPQAHYDSGFGAAMARGSLPSKLTGKCCGQTFPALNVRFWHLSDIGLCAAHVR